MHSEHNYKQTEKNIMQLFVFAGILIYGVILDYSWASIIFYEAIAFVVFFLSGSAESREDDKHNKD